jgi:hypothetical protein
MNIFFEGLYNKFSTYCTCAYGAQGFSQWLLRSKQKLNFGYYDFLEPSWNLILDFLNIGFLWFLLSKQKLNLGFLWFLVSKQKLNYGFSWFLRSKKILYFGFLHRQRAKNNENLQLTIKKCTSWFLNPSRKIFISDPFLWQSWDEEKTTYRRFHVGGVVLLQGGQLPPLHGGSGAPLRHNLISKLQKINRGRLHFQSRYLLVETTGWRREVVFILTGKLSLSSPLG